MLRETRGKLHRSDKHQTGSYEMIRMGEDIPGSRNCKIMEAQKNTEWNGEKRSSVMPDLKVWKEEAGKSKLMTNGWDIYMLMDLNFIL